MSRNHLESVARLNVQQPHSAYHGYAGIQLLMCYYDIVTQGRGACGYVAEANGNAAGYVCGFWNPGEVQRLLIRQHAIRLVFWGAVQTFSRPSLLSRSMSRLSQLTRVSRHANPDANTEGGLPRTGYEVRPIFVNKDFRRRGVGTLLLQKLIDDAAERQFDRLFLYTEQNNMPANALYRKLGFDHVSTHQTGGTTYLRYEIRTGSIINEPNTNQCVPM